MSRPEDLTARARIREAALRLFGERGVEATTVRDIAREAGVSPGLLRHHFGSKEDLRDACDKYAIKYLTTVKTEAYGEAGDNLGLLASVHPEVLRLLRYFAHSALDGSAATARIYDQLVDLTEQWFKDHPENGQFTDPRASAAVLVALQMGMLVMHEHVSRGLGADILSPEGMVRMGHATVDIYGRAMLTPEIVGRAHAAYDAIEQQLESKKAGNDD
jgi:AcrR family transcriptional regulator